MTIFVPCFKYFSANSPFLPKATQLIKSASASPSLWYRLFTANVYLAIQVDFSPCEYLISGFLVKRPIKITLFIKYLLFVIMVYIVENRTMNTYIPPFHHRTTLINKYDSLVKKIKKSLQNIWRQ